MRKIIRLTLIISFLSALGLAGCGVRGPLEQPQVDKSQSAVGSKKAKKTTTENKPFILDGLLR